MSHKPLRLFISFPTRPLTDSLPNGDGLLAHRIISELAERGHFIQVVTPYAVLRDPFPKNVTVHQIASRDEGSRPGKLRYMRWTRFVAQQVHAATPLDLIHELNPVFSLLSLAFAGLNIPVALGPHSSRWPMDADGKVSKVTAIRQWVANASKDICIRQQHRRASAILLSTQAALNNVAHPEELLNRLFILPPGVDTNEFSPAAASEPTSPTVLFLANVSVRKGIFTLLEAFEQVSRQILDAQLVIAGDGPSLPGVRELVHHSSYRNRVEFLGRVNRADAAAVFRRCTVYCLPSQGEPFGITAIEAMACGKPLVVTESGGLAHIVSDDGGKRVPVRDATTLANALTELLQNPALCRKMGEHNRQQVETYYAWPRIAGRLENIYREILDAGSSHNTDRLTKGDLLAHQRRSLLPTGAPQATPDLARAACAPKPLGR